MKAEDTEMKLHLQSDNSVTLIENTFIDRYMAGANGEFVKLYLYLLRCAGTGQELSVSSIADFFDHTEKDVKRALSYWEKLNLLRLHYDEKGSISDILFLKGDEEDALLSPADPAPPQRSAVIHAESTAPQEQPANDPPAKSFSPSRRKELKELEDIRQLLFVASAYLGRPLTRAESDNILYFYDSLHFSPDLIEYLAEYCASKGSPGARYMEKVALGWYRDGITTVEQAKDETKLYHQTYYLIFGSLGIKGRSPIPGEIAYMDRWLKEWHFSTEVILEACSRTVLQTHQPSFTYVEGILKSWKKENVTSLADVRRLDEAFAAKRTNRQGPQGERDRLSARSGTSNSRFTAFPQRSYDYQDLEQQLLRAQEASALIE